MLTFILHAISERTAKVGAKVYNPSYGFGEIHTVSPDKDSKYRVYARFLSHREDYPQGRTATYTIDGRNECEDECPILFHVPPMLTKTYRVNTIESFIKITADAIETTI